jgi:hypothetical protein
VALDVHFLVPRIDSRLLHQGFFGPKMAHCIIGQLPEHLIDVREVDPVIRDQLTKLIDDVNQGSVLPIYGLELGNEVLIPMKRFQFRIAFAVTVIVDTAAVECVEQDTKPHHPASRILRKTGLNAGQAL